jgi:predicted ATPase
MITKIELDGFKTFQDFKLELAPLQVIVGANGVGKSNLFDALQFLSRLANPATSLDRSFRGLRGETDQLFTTLPNGKTVEKMTLAVELLVEPKVVDRLGYEGELKYRRLRYEIELYQRESEKRIRGERFEIKHEALISVPFEQDTWAKKYNLGWQKFSAEKRDIKRFISTEQNNETVLVLHEDDSPATRKSSPSKIEGTMLSSVSNTEFPHALAVQQEMQKWQFLHLYPEELRTSRYNRDRIIYSSNNIDLNRMLVRLAKSDKTFLKDVARDLANLIPNVVGLKLEKDRYYDQIAVVEMQDGRSFPWQGLSDGTLRMLALATLKNQPDYSGVLCFEEPENGVHPFRLKNMVKTLKGLATDFSDEEQRKEPLRQLLVNTHSPVLISQPEVIQNVLFAYTVNRVKPEWGDKPLRVTQIVPVSPARANEGSYSLDQIKDYLNSVDEESLALLERE